MVDATTPLPAGSKVGEKDSNDRIIGWVRLFDSALTDALGTVAGTPAAGTLLGRLLAIATPLGTPADGAWASGNGTIPALLKALAGALGFPADAAGVSSMIGQLKAHTAALGSPADAAWTGTGNAGLIGLFKAVVLQMLDTAAAQITFGTLTAAETAAAFGKSTDANTVPSLIGLVKLLISYSDGVEGSLVQIGAYLDTLEAGIGATTDTAAVASLIGLMKAQNVAVATIGTRGYGTPLGRYAYTTTSTALSDAIVANEVTLHNCGTGRCYFKLGVAPTIATVSDLPLEPGEKLTLRVTSGHKLTAIGESAGNLNIIPVA
ncbi:MAG TPA: hypothetical protein VF637_00275 [Sphingomicrobium sp.]|jgi:hypothetical protein